MKSIKDLGLPKKEQKKIETWLNQWLDLFIKQADGQEGNVHRADFENDDFFYFTDCNDILIKDPEGKSVETNPKIRARKRKVRLQLLIKTLLGYNFDRPLKCTHCGYEKCSIDATVNGHYTYCPHCKKISLVGYLPTIIESASAVFKELLLQEIKKNNDTKEKEL